MVTKMKSIVDKLDRLVQMWASTQRSEISGKFGCVAHHITGRANHYLRFDKDNLFVCTPEEHNLIHSGVIKVDAYLTPQRQGRRRDKFIYSLTWKPTKEFYEQELKKWKS